VAGLGSVLTATRRGAAAGAASPAASTADSSLARLSTVAELKGFSSFGAAFLGAFELTAFLCQVH